MRNFSYIYARVSGLALATGAMLAGGAALAQTVPASPPASDSLPTPSVSSDQEGLQEIVVTAQRHGALEIGDRLNAIEAVLAAEASVFRARQQVFELGFLRRDRILTQNRRTPAPRIKPEDRRDVDHGLRIVV